MVWNRRIQLPFVLCSMLSLFSGFQVLGVIFESKDVLLILLSLAKVVVVEDVLLLDLQ